MRYQGQGITQMMKICKKHGLNSENSTLRIYGDDLNAKWSITTKDE